MISKYRQKFILITMLSLFVVLAFIIGTINISNCLRINNESDQTIKRILQVEDFKKEEQPPQNGGELPIQNEGELPLERPDDFFFDRGPEARFQTRYFIVNLEDGEITSMELDNIASIDEESAKEYAKVVSNNNRLRGYYQNFRFYKTEDGKRIVFLECTKELNTVKSFFLISFFISLGGYFLVFILIVILSKIVVKPFVKNQEKQKRFITDASHELKTPLTIISANTEVIELENGASKWSESIKKQVERLRKLTNQLTLLSKMDEGMDDFKFSTFNLSSTLNETIDDCANIFKVNNQQLSTNIENDIEYYGNQELLNELCFIMLDNAYKYSTGEIKVQLSKDTKGIHLIFMNEANVPDGNLDYLFNRFTRLDSDRNSETGGTGIGLSIAKEIICLHKGEIKASGLNNTITFDIYLKQ